MKKWGWIWLIATFIDAGIVIFQGVLSNGMTPEIVPFDFLNIFHNLFYWWDSIWYVFNLIAINCIFSFLGYLLIKQLQQKYPRLPKIILFIFLYLTFGALMVLAKVRFNIIYPSYLYHPFNVESIEIGLIAMSSIILVVAGLGYIFLNVRYWKGFLCIYMILIIWSYYPYVWGIVTNAKTVKNLDKPNVVYILLDALRPDHLQVGGAPFDIMPKLNTMIEQKGVFYKDVTVSVGRSFPSAVAILSGQHAIRNGARDNLFSKKSISYAKNLAHILRNEGYQTIAANDAVQFWNFDYDYGFESIWTAGLSSLKLMPLEVGGFMPLPLLFANTRLGEIFFPYTYSDRNIDDLYHTDSYVQKLTRQLNFIQNDKPLFLFMSMELTHTPYADENPYSQSIVQSLQSTEYADACHYFLASMNILDDQLFQVLDALKQYGRLDNTLLIIGSDHGQGFNMSKDMYITHEGKEFNVLEAFYGNNAINPSSTNLMVSMFSFMPNINFKPGIREQQIESVDIAPTIVDLLGIESPYSMDGQTFKTDLFAAQSIEDRLRFVESGFKSRPDFKKGQSTELTELSRRVRFDLNHLTQEWNDDGQLFIELNKDRAVYYGQWALMTQDVLGSPYIFNQKQKIVWPLLASPSDVPVQKMLQAWCEHYALDIPKLKAFGVTEQTIAQGYCQADKQTAMLERISHNEQYNEKQYSLMDRKVKRNTQFICTREHLY
ncbi:sulfatase-like hydrolase/transferase [Wohlfahrtiimonas chitiniclastica]|uniref:sulfatase-like hydrolase/transferase n=1 Tax=Wohlfahrtiimonas chitiniclastica TaxID=400946 RepID=UPI001BCD5261|nr:sulfatase-like hydrolase/transferase [Wohlfahrtiimonas chitiniclastica]MBS7836400.1 sulfatase-like hydrolase/transferase [Wohlfahrtiimonas chitiniclastica]